MADSMIPLNLRRLLSFHHASGREAAGVIGASEHAVSAWLTGKREPNMQMMMRLADLYDFDPRDIAGDPLDFAQELADPARIEAAEKNIRAAAGAKLTPKERQIMAGVARQKKVSSLEKKRQTKARKR